MVALAMTLQRCTVHSRMPPGVLCRAVQELHRCLTPMIESGDQFELNMLNVARRDPMAPAPTQSALLLTPRVEEPISVPDPSNHPFLSQRRLYSVRIWPWCQGEDHQCPLGLPFCGQMSPNHLLWRKQTGQ